RAAQRDYQLLQGILQSKRGAGNYFLFDYIAGGPRIDLSASQYGVLGMWAASELMEVPTTYWKTTDEVWGKFAQKDGGWAYKGIPDLSTSPTTPSMTAAGVATLYITQDFLLREEGLNCKG